MEHGAMTRAGEASTLAEMMQRADSLVARANRLLPAPAPDSGSHAVVMTHDSHQSASSGAEHVVKMAIGLRGLLQHMDAIHRAGVTLEGNEATAMTDWHQRCATLLGDLEKTVQSMELMHATQAKMSK